MTELIELLSNTAKPLSYSPLETYGSKECAVGVFYPLSMSLSANLSEVLEEIQILKTVANSSFMFSIFIPGPSSYRLMHCYSLVG